MALCLALSRSIRGWCCDAVLEDQEETGWKYIHGDVFRFPPHKNIFCAFVGTGAQVRLLSILVQCSMIQPHSVLAKCCLQSTCKYGLRSQSDVQQHLHLCLDLRPFSGPAHGGYRPSTNLPHAVVDPAKGFALWTCPSHWMTWNTFCVALSQSEHNACLTTGPWQCRTWDSNIFVGSNDEPSC